MRKKNLLLMGIFSLGILSAQVGIKTSVPYTGSVFHIDGAGNNTSSTSVTADLSKDDILVDTRGNMGIGTVTPIHQLEVIAGSGEKFIRLDDGTNFAATPQKILISDEYGVGTWQDRAYGVYIGNRNLSGLEASSGTAAYSGKSLTLTKGKWIIQYSFTWDVLSFSTKNAAYLNTYVSTSSTSLNILPGSWELMAVPYQAAVAYSKAVIIYDVLTTTQTVYLWTRADGVRAITYNILSIPTNIFEAIRW